MDARGIAGLGTECADIELPWKTKQAVKQMLAGANRYSVVQVNQTFGLRYESCGFESDLFLICLREEQILIKAFTWRFS